MRGPGRLTKAANRLTDNQRAELGRDEFFTVRELARILDVSDKTLHRTIDGGELPGFWVTRNGKRQKMVKGLAAIRWKDRLAGTSDGNEQDFQEVKLQLDTLTGTSDEDEEDQEAVA